MATLACLITEFYSTTDAHRRTQLDHALTQIRKSGEAFEGSFELLDFSQPTSVQHFGASIIYETIRNKWEDCIANEVITSRLKGTLIEKLTLGAHFQNQSVTNKLSSSLALFALYSIPDVWPEPVQDLTGLWAGRPELLLRVLAELAAEFHHVQMPLTQRNVLKSSLNKMSVEVMNVLELVLQSEESSGSLKNASIDCVEQWLKVPSAELSQWQPILNTVFLCAINDFAALARILTVISALEDIQTHNNMALEIASFIAHNICPVIGDRINAMEKMKLDNGSSVEMEDLRSLLYAVVGIITNVLRALLIHYDEGNNEQSLSSLCSFFSVISSWPGHYAVDEIISDSADSFWESLKDDVTNTADDKVKPQTREKVISMCRPHYASILQSSVDKLTYLPFGQFEDKYDQEQRDCFESYRLERRETSMHAFVVVGNETLNFLNQSLREAIQAKDCCRCESILLLFERVADYLSETEMSYIDTVITLCSHILSWESSNNIDESRLGITLMSLIYSLSHLVLTSAEVERLGGQCIQLGLYYLANPSVSAEALNTLEHLAEYRTSDLMSSANGLIERCYAYFMDKQNPRELRLRAIKCVGFGLSLYQTDFVLSSLDSILAPRLLALQCISEGRMPSTSQSIESLEDECLFELGVFSVLIASIQPRVENREIETAKSPVFVAMSQCVPLFQQLLNVFVDSPQLVEKVCDALRCGATALGSGALPFVEIYCDVIDGVIIKHPVTACRLAKSVFIVFGNTPEFTRLSLRLKNWLEGIYSMDKEDLSEEYIELAYHVVRKCWHQIRNNEEQSGDIIRLMMAVSVKVLSLSHDPSICRKSALLILYIMKSSVDVDMFGDILQQSAENVISVVFSRLEQEVINSTVESLAMILMFFARRFPKETRLCLQGAPNGNDPLVLEMLSNAHNARPFKQAALRFNMQIRRQSRPL